MTSRAHTSERVADWFRQWRMPLRKFLLGRTGVPAADIDDVAQEVFLRLWRYEKAELIEQPQAYLFKIASNVAAEWSIRSRNTRPHEPRWLTGLVAEDQPDEQALRESAQAEVERAINVLAPGQREVLKLFYSEGLRQDEIAERLAWTPRSVRRHLAKSYVRLRRELDVELLQVIGHGRE